MNSEYIGSLVGGVKGGLVYKGTVSSASDLPSSSEAKVGWLYIADTAFTLDGEQVEIGDELYWNGTTWNIVQGNITPADVYTGNISFSQRTSNNNLYFDFLINLYKNGKPYSGTINPYFNSNNISTWFGNQSSTSGSFSYSFLSTSQIGQAILDPLVEWFKVQIRVDYNVVFENKFYRKCNSIADGEQGYTTGDQVYDYVNSHGFDPSSMETVTDPVILDTPQADWNQADSTAQDYIKNKPDVNDVWSVEYHSLSTSQNRVYFRIYKNYRPLPDTEIGSLWCEIRKVDESDGTPTVVGSSAPIYAGYGNYYIPIYNSPTIDSSVFRFKIHILFDRLNGLLLAHTDCINYNYIGNIETLLAQI